MDTTTPDERVCAACPRALHPTVNGQLCDRCRQATGQHLATLPGLYEQLATVLVPSRTTLVGSRGSSRSAPPVDLHVVDLQEETPGVLTTWVRDWADTLRIDPPEGGGGPAALVAACCRWLRFHWDRADRQHDPRAVAEFVSEIGTLHRRVAAAVTGDRGERRIGLACPCGAVLRAGISTGRVACGGCGTEYDHAGLGQLTITRGVAA